MVKVYSWLELEYPLERLVALSGLVQRYNVLTDGTYLAGF